MFKYKNIKWTHKQLLRHCDHETRKCSFSLLQEHFIVCQREDVTCDDCKGKMQRRLLHEHTTSECPNRIVQCEYCEMEFEFWVTEVRLLNVNLNLLRILGCDYCEEEFVFSFRKGKNALYLYKLTSKSHSRISRFWPRHVCI